MNYLEDPPKTKQVTKKILRPILYADIFDYPLTIEEVYSFQEFKISLEEMKTLLKQAIKNQEIIVTDGFYSLPGKAHLAATRKERWEAAQKLWPKAIHYGQWIASLPFVKMVSITGSLSVNNPRDGVDDIDYLIVTHPNRLWLCRAIIILLVRYGHWQGVHLCPNFLITENVILFEDTNLYTAREMLQMVPIYGKSLYLKMMKVNDWVTGYLPQGKQSDLEKINDHLSPLQNLIKRCGEFIFKGALGNILEKKLQTIQIRKHTRIAKESGTLDKITLTPDMCKGHYDGHNNRTMKAYKQRVKEHNVNSNGNNTL